MNYGTRREEQTMLFEERALTVRDETFAFKEEALSSRERVVQIQRLRLAIYRRQDLDLDDARSS